MGAIGYTRLTLAETPRANRPARAVTFSIFSAATDRRIGADDRFHCWKRKERTDGKIAKVTRIRAFAFRELCVPSSLNA